MNQKLNSGSDVSDANAAFWDDLCGSQAARALGATDSSPDSLRKYDDWYLSFYPYLLDTIGASHLPGKDVLEIGLGYGTLSEALARLGTRYTGLDIAAGPVHMVNHRLRQNQLGGLAVQGSILQPPFSPESFDTVVAVGSLHHTGNLAAAIERCYDLLRPGGRLCFMVYYAYSYRRWLFNQDVTLRYLRNEMSGYRGPVDISDTGERDRAAYDQNAGGEGAPHTDWIFRRSLKHMCTRYRSVVTRVRNIDIDIVSRGRRFVSRDVLLRTPIPRLWGLDLYAVATK